MFGLGTTELIIILVIIVILFGARRLPEIGKGIGEAIKNFKKSTSEPDEIDVTPDKKSEGSADTKDKKSEESADTNDKKSEGSADTKENQS